MESTRDKLAKKKTKLSIDRDKIKDHPASLDNYHEGSFFNVDIKMIMPNPEQPRKYFDPSTLKELSKSIKQKGVLQPVIIRKSDDDKIYLVAGERRFKAAQIAGLDKIPAVITKGNPLEIAMIENLQRENLKPIEEAEALQKMIENYEYTHEKLAFAIGKARSTITEILSLNKLPERIKDECRRADIHPRRLLIEIAKQKDSEEMLLLFKQIKTNKLKSEQVREKTRKKQEKAYRTPAAIALDKTISLSNFLKKIDLNAAEKHEKTQLILELDNLKKYIENILNIH